MNKEKMKLMLSIMRELSNGNVPDEKDYDITQKEFFEILIACQNEGYINDLETYSIYGKDYKMCLTHNMVLTVLGNKRLNQNSIFSKIYKILKEIRGWLPFFN